MRILAIERPVDGVTDSQFTSDLLADEAARVYRLYQEGTIRELYFRADEPNAVLELECADLAEADRALASLPLVEAGLIQFEVIPLRPYPGFSRLFSEPD